MWLVRAWGGRTGHCYGYMVNLRKTAGSVLREVARNNQGRNKDGFYDSVLVLYRADSPGDAAVEVDPNCESKPSVDNGFCDLVGFLNTPMRVIVS